MSLKKTALLLAAQFWLPAFTHAEFVVKSDVRSFSFLTNSTSQVKQPGSKTQGVQRELDDGESCFRDSDCGNYFHVCPEETLVCQHKNIFPMYLPEFVGLGVLSALVGLANVSGIGGGGITVPLVSLCWGFTTK